MNSDKTSDENLGTICETDKRIAELSGYPPEFHHFQEQFNPGHYYCRLMELGLSKDTAIKFCKGYKVQYDLFMKYMIVRYHVKNVD